MAALERFPRDGHGGDEAGGERHPELLFDWPGPTQPPHPGHTPLHPVQDVARGQSHYPRNPGEDEVARALQGEKRQLNSFNHCYGNVRCVKILNRDGKGTAPYVFLNWGLLTCFLLAFFYIDVGPSKYPTVNKWPLR